MAVAMVSNVVADAAAAAAGVFPPIEKASHGLNSHQHGLFFVISLTDSFSIQNKRKIVKLQKALSIIINI
jgi:hypothetical protein